MPIKRSKYIIELSKDHHSGLLFCWKIKEGLKQNTALERINKYVNYFWENHLKAHFSEEDFLLFSRIDDPLTSQGKNEHTMITLLLSKINDAEGNNSAAYEQFAEYLTRHIRFEERVLFPFLEQELPDHVLTYIGNYLAKQHETPFKDNFEDEFWLERR
ncbi:Hemerythrin-like domain-containing protein [Mucilaginibacter pineti]|uniref:Hemerythrin-like domain-containing protein n=1 Tax=Mucilaginibacter pineti TaxID=1391627 RepID=A0A1G7NHH7_9SPHI|nr:hemerythrin domain-containing protein [Mucilaginibacter pineti]SDF73371.1 Hemerythrin-like domain-containing protein [Mucilaginibacter pineti]